MYLVVQDLVRLHPDRHFIYPVHLNPNIADPVRELFGERSTNHMDEEEEDAHHRGAECAEKEEGTALGAKVSVFSASQR